MAQKARYGDPAQRRLYPIGTFNSWCARPLSAALAPILTPNQVSLASLLTSLAGFWLIWSAQWQNMAIGAGLVHLGLLLDHADGQVARRTGKGSTWGMYLDMVIDRVVEIGLILSLYPAMFALADLPWAAWELSAGVVVPLSIATLGLMLLWRFLGAYNDILYLRSHLIETGRIPHADAKAKTLTSRPLMPLVFTRDWVLLIWLVGVVSGQISGLVVLLFVLHLLVCLEKIIVFKARHKQPEGDANRVLGKDYH